MNPVTTALRAMVLVSVRLRRSPKVIDRAETSGKSSTTQARSWAWEEVTARGAAEWSMAV